MTAGQMVTVEYEELHAVVTGTEMFWFRRVEVFNERLYLRDEIDSRVRKFRDNLLREPHKFRNIKLFLHSDLASMPDFDPLLPIAAHSIP